MAKKAAQEGTALQLPEQQSSSPSSCLPLHTSSPLPHNLCTSHLDLRLDSLVWHKIIASFKRHLGCWVLHTE